MGKAIIVPNVDWSNKNLGQVTAGVLAITGNSMIQLTGTFSAVLAGELVNAQWEISDDTVASLSSSAGNTITVTALKNGTATLYATYNGETAELEITADNGAFTQDDITQNLLHYYYSGANTRAVVVLDIEDASTFNGTLKNNSALIKFGVQLWDANQVVPSSNSASPSIDGTIKTTRTTWDSGWIMEGNTKSFDSNCNKNNTPAPATSSNTAVRVAIACTYVSGNTGMPTLAEIKNAIELEYFAE